MQATNEHVQKDLLAVTGQCDKFRDDLNEEAQSFNLRWQGAHPGNDLTWPDHVRSLPGLLVEVLGMTRRRVLSANELLEEEPDYDTKEPARGNSSDGLGCLTRGVRSQS